ncbi:MAG: Fur family transcriptional regulator, ferric uptake regulator [Patescibacteria group bacterium]|nr:Fur family transcriptional regulator, ferric uptake regulator [Patescibacteria group bacterium]
MQRYTQANIEEMIRESGLKLTDHRVNILFKISKARSATPAYKLIEDLKKKYDIDQATVYRNLKSLEESGLVRRFDYNHGHSHYEIYDEENSNKIICPNCETVEKISGINLDEIVKKLYKKSKKFKSAKELKIDIYSNCKNCA